MFAGGTRSGFGGVGQGPVSYTHLDVYKRQVWRQADHYKVPRMIYVNKMDIMGADFYRVVRMMRKRLKCNAVPIQLPIGKEDTFKGIIDLIDMKADVYYDDMGNDVRVEEIPDDMKAVSYTHLTGAVPYYIQKGSVTDAVFALSALFDLPESQKVAGRPRDRL